MWRWRLAVLMACWACMASQAAAQGLVMRLPEDGAWVRFEGTYAQTEVRPNNAAGRIEIPPWREQITVKSVGTEMAEFRGETVPCRWIEVKVERGREAEGKIDVGVSGLEIYKVLVPEAAVSADPVLDDGIPNSFLPIIRGYRKLGQGEPQPIAEPAFRVYPLAVLFGYCRDLQTEEKGVDPGIGLGAVSADVLVGSCQYERKTSRTQLETKIWASTEVPFGIAAWSAKIIRSVKDEEAPRANFQPVTQVNVELKAQQAGTNATSDLSVN
uniref:Uncharacterized protein n=1 Tax=Schlesneria paludicola TaxID=360056 RepID=A0A7C4QNH5_9PLAN